MPQEPTIRSAVGRPHRDYDSVKDAYNHRWRWWYSAISDWMIENPGGIFADCAKKLNKSLLTIQLVAGSDLFRDFHSQRLEEWRRTHDFALANKLTLVAEKSLDLTLDILKRKGDQVPLKNLVEITSTSLESLGYGPKTQPTVVVNNSQQVIVPISTSELAEAREALRRAEERRIGSGSSPLVEAEVVEETSLPLDEGEANSDPTTLAS